MIKEKSLILDSTIKYRTVKPEDIIAAGGTDAWADKVGYAQENLLDGLSDAPKTDMTDLEFEEALEYFHKNK